MKHWVPVLLVLGFWGPLVSAQDDNNRRENPMARFEDTTETYQDFRRTGKYRESLEYLEKAINRSAEVPLLWLYDRADLYYEVGEVDRAISEIEWLHYRRPSPKSALQLAIYYRARGDIPAYRRTMERAANRYRRFRGGVDETDNALAMIRIKEMLGENPRSLFQDILSVEEREPENTLKRYLAAGELAWRKFDFQLASEYFDKVLKQDEENLDAMVGLAECYWKSGDPRLGEMLEAIQAVNPIHPRALAIMAELNLENDRFEEALDQIEQVLDFNPNHMRFLGLKSAAYFLMGKPEESEQIRQQALLFNPYAAEVLRITGRILSRKYRFKEAAGFQKRALELDPDDALARAYYAFDLLRLGRDEEGYAELKKSFEADRFNVQVFNMLELMDKVQEFVVVERDGFKLQIPKREREVWGDDALDMLAEAMKQLEVKYRMKVERPVSVQIFDDHDDFMVRSLGLPGMVGFLGICFGNLITMDAPSARTKGTMNWQATLWHEFVHVITLQKTGNRIPRWLSEGISVYEEVERNPSWGQLLAPPYLNILDEDGLPGLDDLEPYLTQPKSGMHTMYGYFASGEFVMFYVDRFGHPALVDALEAIGKGVRAEEALVAAAGASKESLDDAFKTYLGERVKTLKNLEGPAGGGLFRDQARPVPDPKSPFLKAMQAGADAMRAGDMEKAEKELLKARDLFPEYTGEDGPRGMLAQIYRRTNNTEGLRTILEEALTYDGADLNACLDLLPIYTEEEAWQKLHDTARTGMLIDPFDLNMHRAYSQALEKLNKPDEALNQLNRLITLDKARAVDYRLKRLDLLKGQKRLKEAKSEAVRLLEDVPYSWEAQKRLLDIVEEGS
ncbi:MAG: tetratricopeptide repeat protein [Acidobacteriota bacterium]|nr:tetratricopeptide repeat protein [Acidobacteriota bacterium]